MILIKDDLYEEIKEVLLEVFHLNPIVGEQVIKTSLISRIDKILDEDQAKETTYSDIISVSRF